MKSGLCILTLLASFAQAQGFGQNEVPQGFHVNIPWGRDPKKAPPAPPHVVETLTEPPTLETGVSLVFRRLTVLTKPENGSDTGAACISNGDVIPFPRYTKDFDDPTGLLVSTDTRIGANGKPISGSLCCFTYRAGEKRKGDLSTIINVRQGTKITADSPITDRPEYGHYWRGTLDRIPVYSVKNTDRPSYGINSLACFKVSLMNGQQKVRPAKGFEIRAALLNRAYLE